MVIVKRYKLYNIRHTVKKFTFQYGYSKTIKQKLENKILYRFTFQYGYSKTYKFEAIPNAMPYLHSSMVIVKLFIFWFCWFGFLYLHSSMVIVKLQTSREIKAITIIYIPVWL